MDTTSSLRIVKKYYRTLRWGGGGLVDSSPTYFSSYPVEVTVLYETHSYCQSIRDKTG